MEELANLMAKDSFESEIGLQDS